MCAKFPRATVLCVLSCLERLSYVCRVLSGDCLMCAECTRATLLRVSSSQALQSYPDHAGIVEESCRNQPGLTDLVGPNRLRQK